LEATTTRQAGEQMIAAAKRIIARISSIIFWPLNMLAKSVTKANKRMIRWAIRRRVGFMYLFAIFWFPTLTVCGLIWALLSVHEKPDDAWGPVAGIILVILKKVLALISYVIDQLRRSLKAIRNYRRHFS
jgi:hypothetical protein